jgi:hypothetical protein
MLLRRHAASYLRKMPKWQKAKVTPLESNTNSEAKLIDQLASQKLDLQSTHKQLEELERQINLDIESLVKAQFLAVDGGWIWKAKIRIRNYKKTISVGPKIFETYGFLVGKEWMISILKCAEYKSGTGEFEHYRIPKEHANRVDISLRKLLLYCIVTMPVSNGCHGRANTQSIEERNFQGGLIVIEMHFTQKPPIGRKAAGKAMETIKRTMDKTLKQSEVRYAFNTPHYYYGTTLICVR